MIQSHSVILATEDNQVNCEQKTQIVDAACNAVAVTNNALDVNLAGSAITFDQNLVSINGQPLTPSDWTLLFDAMKTALETMDNWDEASRAAVNLIVGQIGVQAGSGATTANTQRVVIATDQPALPTTDTTTGTWANGTETAVAAAAVQVQAANANRRRLVVQNTGAANVRIGIAGVTATTGIQLPPGALIIFQAPYIETAAIYAIREGAVSSIVLTQETT